MPNVMVKEESLMKTKQRVEWGLGGAAAMLGLATRTGVVAG